MAERLGNCAINQKVSGLIPGHAKVLHPTCLVGVCPCTYCKSLWIRVSAKCKCKLVLVGSHLVQIRVNVVCRAVLWRRVALLVVQLGQLMFIRNRSEHES